MTDQFILSSDALTILLNNVTLTALYNILSRYFFVLGIYYLI